MDTFLILGPGGPPVAKPAVQDPTFGGALYEGCAVIEVDEFSFGAKRPTTFSSTGPGLGKLDLQELMVKKRADSSSPSLFRILAMGQQFPVVQLYVRVSGAADKLPKPHLGFEFQTTLVTGLEWGGGSGDADATESVTFEYGALVVAVRGRNLDGTLTKAVKSGWNLVTNKEQLETGIRLLE